MIRTISVAMAALVLGGAGARAQTAEIAISTFQFAPREMSVAAGTTIRWTNADGIEHSATSADGPVAFDTGLFGKGAAREITLTEPGRYAYFCARHPSMKAVVIVEG